MKIKDICTRTDCPLKNWPTKEKNMELAFQILFNIVRSSMPKYVDYDKNKKLSSALISEWVGKMLKAMPEHYDSIEMQRQIFSNIIITLVNTYKKDGLPREVLNEFIAKEGNKCNPSKTNDSKEHCRGE